MSILIVSPTNAYTTKRLQAEVRKLDARAEFIDAGELHGPRFDVGRYDSLYVRQGFSQWTEVKKLVNDFALAGKKVVDANLVDEDMHLGKLDALEKLSKAGIPVPTTSQWSHSSFAFPLMLKWQYGLKGRGVFVVRSVKDAQKVLEEYPAEELLAQKFIEADFEYRVMLVGYKSLPVLVRYTYDKKTYRVDSNQGTVIKTADLPELAAVAEKASHVLGRELSRADILEKDGKFYVLEVNRWPGIESFEKFTGYNVAKDFIEYLSVKVQP